MYATGDKPTVRLDMLKVSPGRTVWREKDRGRTPPHGGLKALLLTTALIILLPLSFDSTSGSATAQSPARGDSADDIAAHDRDATANAENQPTSNNAVVHEYDASARAEIQTTSNSTSFKPGDRIRLAFYERLDDSQDKWRETRSSEAAFHQFSELCGEFEVQDDGSLSLPILGYFGTGGEDQQGLSAKMEKAFEKLIGRRAFVNIVSVEHQPVYIVGNVKNPAAFQYVKGMTVMHLVALAGGTRVAALESWQLTEGRREIDRLKRSLERVKRLLVRTALLRTEGGFAMPKETISGLVGRKDYEMLLAEEGEQRQLDVTGRASAAASLIATVNAAREDLNAKLDRLKPLDQLLEVREQREKTLAELVDRAVVSRPALVQSQGELVEVQDRKQAATIDADSSRTHLAETERSLAEDQLQSIVDRDRLTASAARDTLDAIEDSKEGLTLLTSLEPKDAPVESTFEVSRRVGEKTLTIHLQETDELEPGDLVQVQEDR